MSNRAPGYKPLSNKQNQALDIEMIKRAVMTIYEEQEHVRSILGNIKGESIQALIMVEALRILLQEKSIFTEDEFKTVAQTVAGRVQREVVGEGIPEAKPEDEESELIIPPSSAAAPPEE